MHMGREIDEKVVELGVVAAKYYGFFRRHGQKRRVERKFAKGVVNYVLSVSASLSPWHGRVVPSAGRKEMKLQNPWHFSHLRRLVWSYLSC